jgi:hypothetical protein
MLTYAEVPQRKVVTAGLLLFQNREIAGARAREREVTLVDKHKVRRVHILPYAAVCCRMLPYAGV